MESTDSQKCTLLIYEISQLQHIQCLYKKISGGKPGDTGGD